MISRDERRRWLEREDGALPITEQVELLGISRASVYYHPRPPSDAEVTIKHRIDEIYTEHPYDGSRRMQVTLQQEHRSISRQTVQQYMREMSIAAIYPGPNLSRRNQQHAVYPYLLRHVSASYPNHIWGIDITYIRLQGGWMYLVAVLDWYSRYVISWQLDHTLEMAFVLDAVDRALLQAQPAIWNSDQGSHFTSAQYLERLKAANVRISMDGKGRALDNIFTERLWRTIKQEEVYRKDYATPRECRQQLTQYLALYNEHRPHQSLRYQSPSLWYHHSPEERLCRVPSCFTTRQTIPIPDSKNSAGKHVRGVYLIHLEFSVLTL